MALTKRAGLRRLLAAGALLLLGCVKSPPPGPVHWTALASGLHWASTWALVGPDKLRVPVYLLRLQPQRFRLAVVRAADHGRTLWDAEGFRTAAGALAAMNAGYFDPQWRPLGLLVSDGNQLSRLRRVDHGVFSIAGGRVALDHARQFQPPADLEFAIECGPRLVVDGAPLHFKPGTDRRVALGKTASGDVVLAASDGVLSLAEWAGLLAAPESAGGAGLVDALNLDGGSSAMLSVADGAFHFDLRSAVQVPVGIVVFPRKSGSALGR